MRSLNIVAKNSPLLYEHKPCTQTCPHPLEQHSSPSPHGSLGPQSSEQIPIDPEIDGHVNSEEIEIKHAKCLSSI